MPRPQNPLDDRQQRGELITGTGRIARLSCPVSKVGASVEGVRMLRAQGLLAYGQQRRILVAQFPAGSSSDGTFHLPGLPATNNKSQLVSYRG